MRPRADSPSRRTLASLLAVAAGLSLWHGRSLRRELGTARELHGEAYAGSSACLPCHPTHHESWQRTYHRAMTAEASERSVLAPFDGRSLDWRGVRATFTRDAQGAYWMTFTEPRSGRVLERDRVDRTVGSHRYQQYLTRRGDTYLRLPVAWHPAQQRFFHMNSAFFAPDPEPDAPVWPREYGRYVARWNDNCVFCHNVAPNPGRDARTGAFRTQVAELGVACEACHGPAALHASVNRDPARRYALHLSHAPDPTVVNPARLGPARAADLCGRCHGQRITEDVGPFLSRGDPFVPGDDLARYSSPLWRDTTLGSREGLFAPRFWADGTARLTAYEFQGLLQSPCAQRGELTCASCHSMHQGDPRNQLRPERPGDALCTQCHQRLASAPEASAHARHRSPPSCVACHMPRVVYGVLGAHVSHRIERPDPARAAQDHRPDACTQCHADRSRAWAAALRANLWSERPSLAPQPEELGPELDRALFAGDPVERALAAAALGAAPPGPEDSLARRRGALLEALLGDRYATVRTLAWSALLERAEGPAREALRAVDPALARLERARVEPALRAAFGVLATEPAADLVAALRASAEEHALEVGE